MTKHRQPECRFGDEHVAKHKLEWRAGRVERLLVIAGGDHAQVRAFDFDLGRAEHVTGRMEGYLGAAEIDALAIADGLRGTCKGLAVAQPHEIESLARGEHRAVARARVIGMGMRNERLFDRLRRVDVETTGLAAHPGGSRQHKIFGTHAR